MTQTPDVVVAAETGRDELTHDDVLAAFVPRELVPTDRERGLGAPDPADVVAGARQPQPETVTVERVGALRRLAGTFGALNPNAVVAGGPKAPLFVLSAIAAVSTINIGAFAAVAPLIRIQQGVDFSTLVALENSVFAGAMLLAPLAGHLSDRINRLWLVRLGAGIGALAALLSALTGGGALVAVRFLAGVGYAFEPTARLPLIADYYPAQSRARAFGFVVIGQTLGAALGTAIVVVLVYLANVPFQAVIGGFALLSLIPTALLFTLRRPEPQAALPVDSDLARPLQLAEAWRTLRGIGTLRRLWRAQPFLSISQLGLSSFLYFVVSARVQQLTATGGGGPGADLLSSSFALALNLALPAILATVAITFSAPLSERMLRQSPGRIFVFIGTVLALQAVSSIFLIVIPWVLFALLGMVAIGALGGMTLPAQYAVLADILPARVRGIGMQSVAPFGLIGVVLVVIVGAFADTYGPEAAVFLLVVLYLVGAALVASAGGTVARDIRAARAASDADEIARLARLRGQARMIICRDVDVHYAGTQVLFGVDLEVDEGELVALLGTNGAGKSTLLRAICGVHEASNGAVFLDGEDVTHQRPHLNARSGVVYVPGGRAIFGSLSVAENLRLAAPPDAALAAARLQEVHELFPVLRERAGEVAGNMSGGEQQMLALAQALLMTPRLLMIDELSLGLAPAVVERLVEVVRRINAAGTTVLLVEQSLNVAVEIAERAVFMDKGRVMFDGPVTELLARADIVRSVFLGGAGGAVKRTAARRGGSGAGEAEPALRCTDLSVAFGGVRALQGVSLDVAPAEVVGVIGPNGAGKTTLMDIIAGYVRPDGGSVLLGGRDVTRAAPDARARAGLARSFQNPRLFTSLTVRECIAVAMDRRIRPRWLMASALWLPQVRRSETRTRRRVENLVESLGLQAFADKFVTELSTGSRRLLDLACILASEPAVLLLDEPSSGLAQAEVELLGPTVRRLVETSGCAVLVIEHDMPLVTSMSDRLVAMDLGRVIASGVPAEVVRDPAVVTAYLAASDAVVQRSGRMAMAHRALEGAGEHA